MMTENKLIKALNLELQLQKPRQDLMVSMPLFQVLSYQLIWIFQGIS